MKDFGLALKRERDRERKRRATRQGAFEARMLSLDRQIEAADEAESPAWLSDAGSGARAIRSFDEGLSQSGADVAYAEKTIRHYRRRYKTAYMRLKRSNKAHLCRTFSLICKYGKTALRRLPNCRPKRRIGTRRRGCTGHTAKKS